MALIDRFNERYPLQKRIELSNPDDTGAGASVNTTFLTYAAADAVGLFRIYAGQDYDESDARHVAIAVGLMYAACLMNAGKHDAGQAHMELYGARAEKLAEQTVTAWAAPTTDGNYTPSAAATGVPPDDSSTFNNLKVSAPRSGPTSLGARDTANG